MKTAKWIIILAMCAFIGYIVYRAVESSKYDPVLTVKPEFRDISRTILVPGTIMPSKEIEIKSNISGVLDELFVQIGQELQKGQVIARIRIETNPVEYQQLQKRKDVAETQFKNSQANYNRSKLLYDQKVIAKADFEKEETSYLLAKAEYESALAEWHLAGNYFQNTDANSLHNMVVATDNGTLLELPVRKGGPVMSRGTFSEGTTVARIASLDTLIFRGYVAEADVVFLKEETMIQLIVGAMNNYKIPGMLRLIAPKGVLREGITKFEIEAEVIIPEELPIMIRAGFSATAEMIVESKTGVLALEEKHLNFSGDSVFVEIPDRNGKLGKTMIVTGISDGIYTEIISGVDTATVIKAYENN
ncbi:MAG: efflux RND transporter periplasmic adaptor subunit [Bacteroidales bacterium]|jgi:HlyD family secretion protein|nr:efflux RND transporter periplasmic adaptor subunit [Bacteroidales bacterium]